MTRGLAALASLWFCDLLAVSELTVVIDLIWFHKVSFLMNSKVLLPLILWPVPQVEKMKTKLNSATENQYTTITMPDGSNYELDILSAIWTWKAKTAHNQPTKFTAWKTWVVRNRFWNIANE